MKSTSGKQPGWANIHKNEEIIGIRENSNSQIGLTALGCNESLERNIPPGYKRPPNLGLLKVLPAPVAMGYDSLIQPVVP